MIFAVILSKSSELPKIMQPSIIFNIIEINKLNMLEGEDGGKRETRRGSSCVPFWSRHVFPNKFNILRGWCLGFYQRFAICTLCVWRRLYIVTLNLYVNCDPIPVDNAIYAQTKRIHGSSEYAYNCSEWAELQLRGDNCMLLAHRPYTVTMNSN